MTSNTSTKSKKAGQVFAIGRVRNAVARGDGEVLRIALKTMREADQDGNPLLYGDTVLGVWMEVILARPAIPEKTLAEFLRARSIVRTIDTADELSRQPEFLGRMKSDLRRDAVKTLLDDFVKRRAA